MSTVASPTTFANRPDRAVGCGDPLGTLTPLCRYEDADQLVGTYPNHSCYIRQKASAACQVVLLKILMALCIDAMHSLAWENDTLSRPKCNTSFRRLTAR